MLLFVSASLLQKIDDATRDVYDVHLNRCDRVVAGVLAHIGVTDPA